MPLNSFGLIFCLCCSKLPLSLLTPELWSCSTLTHCMITRYKAKYFHLDSIRPLFLMMCCTARTRTLKHIARVRATIKKFTNILGRHRRQPIMWIIVFVHSNNPQTILRRSAKWWLSCRTTQRTIAGKMSFIAFNRPQIRCCNIVSHRPS